MASSNSPECPRPELLQAVLNGWDSPVGLILVWPDGSGRFPMRGELLNAMPGRRAYNVSVGAALRCLAKMHDAWDAEQLAKRKE